MTTACSASSASAWSTAFPYVCHLAVSPRWMVHYLNAEMLDNADNRAEEARFMAGFDADFARRHAAAFADLHRRIGLDYFAIDCAETETGGCCCSRRTWR